MAGLSGGAEVTGKSQRFHQSVIWAGFFLQPLVDICFLPRPPSGRDCPLLQVLAGTAVGEKMEGSLPWIVLWLLEGNNYSSLLLHLDPQGGLGRVWGSLGSSRIWP